MLPPAHRIRRSDEYTSVLRTGRRVGSRYVVVHHARTMPAASRPGDEPRVGFVVSRAVGGSVQRNRVSRRLRAQMAARLADLPATSATVVRALPAAASASSAQLGQALDGALSRLGVTSTVRPDAASGTPVPDPPR